PLPSTTIADDLYTAVPIEQGTLLGPAIISEVSAGSLPGSAAPSSSSSAPSVISAAPLAALESKANLAEAPAGQWNTIGRGFVCYVAILKDTKPDDVLAAVS